MMLILDEPGTHRLFVNAMRGPLYSVSYDGKTVTQYLDVNAPAWGVSVQFENRERGVNSFASHPQFNQPGTRGYGKLYTYTDTSNMTPKADFLPSGEGHTHDTVLLEWTAKNPMSATYDGGPPRELFRTAKPFQNHNGGLIGFNPLARPGGADYGLLYVSVADGGSGGDPYKHAQNLSSIFGKILRIDPLGSNSPNGKYGIPATNPFVKNSKLRNARRGVCIWRPESPALLLGSQERQHDRGRHRPEPGREGHCHGRRQPDGTNGRVASPTALAKSDWRTSAATRGHLSLRRVRSQRPDPSGPCIHHRRLCLPADCHQAAHQ